MVLIAHIALSLSVAVTATGDLPSPEPVITSGAISDAPNRLAAPPAGLSTNRPTITSATPSTLPGQPSDDPLAVDVRPESNVLGPLTEYFGPTTGSEVDITNATAWHDAGIDGTGVRIGVIDFFDVTKFWNVDEHGPTPLAGVTAKCFDHGADCTDELFDGTDEGGEDHGIAVVETIRDMAPGVEIYIGQATTISDYRELIDWFVGNRVEIVNRSLGSRYDGPGDGRGPLDDLVAEAVSRGIFWVNSGGNNGSEKYYRHQARLVNDRVAFGPSGTETFLKFNGCVALGGIRWANDWDKPAEQRTDYDAYLWESPIGDPAAGTIVDSSVRRQRAGAVPIEDLIEDRCPTFGTNLYLELRWRGGDITGDLIEILDYGAGISSFTQAEYSAAVSVVDAKSSGVLAVGSIEPAASGTIASFSSRGPTNDGRLAPGVTAPTGFSSSVFGWFAGTSAAAAVVAGGAALLKDADLASPPDSLGDLIRSMTIDRGAAGPDNVYGYGEFRLPTPPDPNGVDTTPSRFVALDTPTRYLDTRPETAAGPAALIGELRRGQIVELPIAGVGAIPETGVTAVVINLVTIAPDQASFMQALPTGLATLGGYSNLNTDAAGQVRANLAIVPIGRDGTISIYTIAKGHVVVDVLGWFEATSGPVAAGRFVELPTAERLVDTRTVAPIGRLETGDVLAVPMPAGVDPAQISSLVLTVTSTEASDPGWLQAFPASQPDAIGTTSTVNIAAGSTVANTAIVPVGTEGVAITGLFAGNGSSHVVVDAIGYITSAAAPESATGRYVSVQPDRAFDSRSVGSGLSDGEIVVIDASDAPHITVPADASGVVWNVAAVQATRPGFLRGWPAEQAEPATSSLNWTLPGETRASATISAVDEGRAKFRIEDGSANLPEPVGHLIADVFGYFT